MDTLIMVFIWLSSAGFAAAVAASKNREGGAWFALGLLFGPIALVGVGFMPVAEKKATADATAPTGEKQWR